MEQSSFNSRSQRYVDIGASLCVLSIYGASLGAQRPVTPSASAAAVASSITTDTGALAAGHRDFARYTTPGLCAEAVRSEVRAARRTLTAQAAEAIARRTPAQDTLPASVVTVARTCGARFSAHMAAARDLPALFTLALAEREDALADTILTRELTSVSTDSQRTQIFTMALNQYLAASPARIDAAKALIARASGGPPVRGAQLWLMLHRALLTFWASERPDAPERAETADSIIQFIRNGRASGIANREKQFLVQDSYRALMSVAYLTHVDTPDSVLLRIAGQARTDLSRIPLDTLWYNPKDLRGGNPEVDADPAGRSASAMREAGYAMRVAGRDWRAVSSAELVQALSPAGSVVSNDATRQNHPPRAQLWVPAGADTLHPPAGGVTLRYHLNDNCRIDVAALKYPDVCSAPLAQLQQWEQTYGPKIQLTIVTPLQGHALYAGIQTPVQEAETMAWYIHEYWHLHAALALLPLASGDAQQRQDPRLEIIGPSGRVIYQGAMMEDAQKQDGMFDNAPFLTALLVHALAPSPASSSAPSSSAIPTP